MLDTSVPDEPETGDQSHKHGPACQHRPVNPFDKGAFFNCTEFCLGAADQTYFELHTIPEPTKKAPVPVLAAGAPTVNTALLNDRGEHLV